MKATDRILTRRNTDAIITTKKAIQGKLGVTTTGNKRSVENATDIAPETKVMLLVKATQTE
jgi:hypothetical protein